MGWLGPVVGDVQHEGWVVPLFADGAEGAGTSSSRGILVARQPGDGPRNGDRVQLSYPDGSQVVGLWQDDALVLEDGVVFSHVRGQLRREVLEEAEEWRPDAAVVGYVAGCECGWRGRPWTRVTSPERADPAARLLANPGPYYDLDDAGERLVIEEWRRHIAPWRSLEDLEEAAARQAAATRELDEAVRAAKAAGASWADIGRATGMTRQSANERWSSRV